MPTTVIYHQNCSDGFTAAWVAWSAMKEINQAKRDLRHPEEDWTFIPCRYGDPFPSDVSEDSSVFILDFSFRREVLLEQVSRVQNIVVLDHHETAMKDLVGHDWPPQVIVEFDMNRSGAGMAWDWFFAGRPRPDIINLVETRDLWRKDSPLWLDARALHMFLEGVGYDVERWDQVANGVANVLPVGRMILSRHDGMVNRIAAQAHPITLLGHVGVAVNAPHMLASDVGDVLSEGQPFAVMYNVSNDKVGLSFRSRFGKEPQALNVADMADHFNKGGGHAGSAGGWVSLDVWSQLIKSNIHP